MKNAFIFTLVLFLASSFSNLVFAQGAPPATPIDGGLSVLLTAGGAYGLSKLMKSLKK